MRSTFQIFVVVPAAGVSRRMGRPKLVLPLGESTVIEHTLTSVRHPRVATTVVVHRAEDVELGEVLARTDASVVPVSPAPGDMRKSIELALKFITESSAPADDDVWILCPGDCVTSSVRLIDELLRRWESEDADILVPRFGGKRGHPALFRWATVGLLHRLAPDVGVNALKLLPGVRVIEHEVQCSTVLADMDTPEDYEALRRRLSEEKKR